MAGHVLFTLMLSVSAHLAFGQLGAGSRPYTHADTLRGSLGPGRTWWDATYYDVTVLPDFGSKSLQARTIIAFQAVAPGGRMQIDLQEPLIVDSVTVEVSVFRDGAIHVEDQRIPFEREGNVIWIDAFRDMARGSATTLTVHYHGQPREARNPPWDGGWIWQTDAKGNPWMSVACQGLGASVWYPCKDHQSDEPEGAALHIVVPDTLVGVGNGRLRSTQRNGDGTTTWNWMVTDPINAYNLVPYIGKYVHFGEVYAGLEGALDCDYWVLAHNEARARLHFAQVKDMLVCFEARLGPYPFPRDGFKLVESPHLGMEHQSAIAYGNDYVNGYRGSDLSGSGHGLKWDFIIVHESGHEWFGNSITTADIADMWVHEGFTQYTEVLMTECKSGRDAAEDYAVGLRRNIRNDRPIIGPYGVNEEGSGDMYPKGANVLHMVRRILGDSAFHMMLLDMNRQYRRHIVTSAEIEAFMDARTPDDLRPLFDQYLRTTKIPVLEWGVHKGRVWHRWSNTIPGFTMPCSYTVIDGSRQLRFDGPVTDQWSSGGARMSERSIIQLDRAWYVQERRVPKKVLKQQRPSPMEQVGWSF